jgi:hypothetical protein
MACPRCGGEGKKVIAPGFYECTSFINASKPVRTAAGVTMMGVSVVCGNRYQLGSPMPAAQACSCRTFSIGTCHDCGRPVCGDHSRLDGGQRVCLDCIQDRRRQEQDVRDTAHNAAHQAAIAEMRALADPTERLLRIAWYQDNFDGLSADWGIVCPEYTQDNWDSAAVGRWFAARAASLGIPPTVMRMGMKRPFSTMFGHRAKYSPGTEISYWSLPRSRYRASLDWVGEILPDGRVVRLERCHTDYPSTPGVSTVVKEIRSANLNMNALILMAEMLKLTVDKPGLRRKKKSLPI